MSSSIGRELNTTAFIDDANLQGYWKLEDVNDSSTNGYNLTNNNTVTFSAAKFNNGAVVAVTGTKYLSRSDANTVNLEIAGSQTWGGWVNAPSETPEGNMMAKANGANTHDIYITGGTPHFRLAGLTTTTDIGSSVSISQNTWNLVIGVYDSSISKLKIFVNGVKTEATASGSAVDTNGEFTIGSSSGGGNGFDGIVDDVFIFDRALSDGEVARLNSHVLGESVALSESTDQKFDFERFIQDTTALSDTLARNVDYSRELNDSLALSDTIDRILQLNAILSDSIGVTDNLDRVLTIDRILSDSVGISDSLDRMLTINRMLANTVGISDTLQRQLVVLDKTIVQLLEIITTIPKAYTDPVEEIKPVLYDIDEK